MFHPIKVKQITVLIIASSEDPASVNIKNSLLEQTSWDTIDLFFNHKIYQHNKMKDIIIITIPDRKITHENLEKEIQEQLGLTPTSNFYLQTYK